MLVKLARNKHTSFFSKISILRTKRFYNIDGRSSEGDEWIRGKVQILAVQNPGYEYRVILQDFNAQMGLVTVPRHSQ